LIQVLATISGVGDPAGPGPEALLA